MIIPAEATNLKMLVLNNVRSLNNWAQNSFQQRPNIDENESSNSFRRNVDTVMTGLNDLK